MKKLSLIGNLGDNAKVVDIKGNKYVSFDIAVTEKKKQEDGTLKEFTSWFSCLQYGEGAKILEFLVKGKKVFVEGNFDTSIYTSKEGESKVQVSLFVKEIVLC